MFDTIVTLLKIFESMFSQLRKWREEKKLHHLGARLYALYVSLNEIILSGRQIVIALRTYVVQAERYAAGVVPWTHTIDTGRKIGEVVIVHLYNLRRVADALVALAPELQILDAEAYRKLKLLLSYKGASLKDLFSQFSTAGLPLKGITPEDVDQMYRQLGSDKGGDVKFGLPEEVRDALTRHLAERPILRLDAPWDRQVYPVVKKYLDEVRPGAQLDVLEGICRALRQTLEQQFDVRDILAEVGNH